MRARYRYDKTTDELVEIRDDEPRPQSGAFVMPDLDQAYGGGFTSPIDGSFITSRSQLAEHNRKHNVRQAGDFKRGELIQMENKRVEAQRAVAAKEYFKWH